MTVTLTPIEAFDARLAVTAAIDESKTRLRNCIRLSASPYLSELHRDLMVETAHYHVFTLRCYEHLYRALGGDLYEYLPAVARLPEMAGCGRKGTSENEA